MKVLTVVDPQIPLSKMHHVGATMLPYDLCQSLADESRIEMSLLVHNDLEVESLNGVGIVDLGEPKARYQQQVYKVLQGIVDDYDIIHIHISTPGFVKYLVEFPKSVQKKIIYTMHTWTNSLAVSYFYRDYFYKLVTDSEVNIVFLTHKQSDALLKSVGCTEFYNRSRIHYIKNAVNLDVDQIYEECQEDDIQRHTGRAIAVGRMVESKGIDKIVKACIETNQKLLLVSPSWRMTPKEQKYRDKVLELINSAPEGLITLSEGMDHHELMKEIYKSNFGILFSTFDVVSLFILECVSLMTPVLAYNAGSTAEVCDIFEDHGVIKFNNYKELVNLLKWSPVDDMTKTYCSLPCDCRYPVFVSNYMKLYNEVYRYSQD